MAAEKKQKKKAKIGLDREFKKKSRFLDKISIFHKNVTCITHQKPNKILQTLTKNNGKNLAH